MKKILALVLAIIMMAAIAVPAFAEDPVRADRTQSETFVGDADNAETASPDVKVTYGVTQSYVIIIPADVTFVEGGDGKIASLESTLAADKVRIAGNEKLTVAIDSLYNYKLVDTNQASIDVDYTIKVDDAQVALADKAVALTVNRPDGNAGLTGSDGSVKLTFATNGTAQEGNFEDYLTFNVSIVVDASLLDTSKVTKINP